VFFRYRNTNPKLNAKIGVIPLTKRIELGGRLVATVSSDELDIERGEIQKRVPYNNKHYGINNVSTVFVFNIADGDNDYSDDDSIRAAERVGEKEACSDDVFGAQVRCDKSLVDEMERNEYIASRQLETDQDTDEEMDNDIESLKGKGVEEKKTEGKDETDQEKEEATDAENANDEENLEGDEEIDTEGDDQMVENETKQNHEQELELSKENDQSDKNQEKDSVGTESKASGSAVYSDTESENDNENEEAISHSQPAASNAFAAAVLSSQAQREAEELEGRNSEYEIMLKQIRACVKLPVLFIVHGASSKEVIAYCISSENSESSLHCVKILQYEAGMKSEEMVTAELTEEELQFYDVEDIEDLEERDYPNAMVMVLPATAASIYQIQVETAKTGKFLQSLTLPKLMQDVIIDVWVLENGISWATATVDGVSFCVLERLFIKEMDDENETAVQVEIFGRHPLKNALLSETYAAD